MTADESLDHTPLTFGKYVGQTPDAVSEKDPNWLCWAYENVKTKPTCSPALYRACQEETRENKYRFGPND